MISSIVLLVLLQTKVIDPNVSMGFWKVYLPVCAIEVIVYFRCLSKWGEK